MDGFSVRQTLGCLATRPTISSMTLRKQRSRQSWYRVDRLLSGLYWLEGSWPGRSRWRPSCGPSQARGSDTGRYRFDDLLIVFPLLALLPVAGFVQRRRLRPVLASASLTNERISYAEVRKNVRAATPLRQSLNALVASLFAFFAAAFAVLIHLITKHFVFDAYVALWGFVSIAFGFASFTWYREILRKVPTDENDRRTGLGPIKWAGLSVLLIGTLAWIYTAADRGDAWGALAVGRAPGAGAVTVSVVAKATENIARGAALQACRSAKNGNDAARSACAVVATFHRECFAFAGAEWAIAVDEKSARKAAAAKCSGAACTIVSGCGKTFWR